MAKGPGKCRCYKSTGPFGTGVDTHTHTHTHRREVWTPAFRDRGGDLNPKWLRGLGSSRCLKSRPGLGLGTSQTSQAVNGASGHTHMLPLKDKDMGCFGVWHMECTCSSIGTLGSSDLDLAPGFILGHVLAI